MRSRLVLVIVVVTLLTSMVFFAQSKGKGHLNPMVDLIQQHKPVYGIYAPNARNLPGAPAAAPRGGGGAGGRGNAGLAAPPQQEMPCEDAARLLAAPPKMPVLSAADIQQETEVAKLTLAHPMDYLFSGDFEDVIVDQPLGRWTEYMKALQANRKQFSHPLMLKAPKVGCDSRDTISNVSKELNLGAVGLMFPHTESARELEEAFAAMRFKSKGGQRPENVGMAPAFWGLSEKEYKDKADLSAMNPNGELVTFAVLEDRNGLRHRREIAQVKGLSVLWPGAGTLRAVFYKQDTDGKWVPDTAAWDAAVQSVADTCKEFKISCGFPANNVQEVELRTKQGFNVFVSGWGDAAFAVVEAGRKATSNNK